MSTADSAQPRNFTRPFPASGWGLGTRLVLPTWGLALGLARGGCAQSTFLTSIRACAYIRDQTLSRLAAQKKAAWDKWSANGRPKEGTLYEAKIRTRADFRKCLRVCVANSERRRIQHFDKQFKQRSSNRFKLPSRRKQQGTALRVNQQVTTEQGTILKAWESHFQEISFN